MGFLEGKGPVTIPEVTMSHPVPFLDTARRPLVHPGPTCEQVCPDHLPCAHPGPCLRQQHGASQAVAPTLRGGAQVQQVFSHNHIYLNVYQW